MPAEPIPAVQGIPAGQGIKLVPAPWRSVPALTKPISEGPQAPNFNSPEQTFRSSVYSTPLSRSLLEINQPSLSSRITIHSYAVIPRCGSHILPLV
jgi:hypothetical protein